MKLTASLPMYDFPEVCGALGVVWSHIALRLEQVGVEGIPAALEHRRGLHDLWADPTLLLSQCCGYDIINRYADKPVALATALYASPRCHGCDYSSVVLVAEDSRATEREAIFIGGIVVLPPSTYKRIAELEQFAVAQSYPELR